MTDRAHRVLRLTSPFASGPDVKKLQRSLNRRLHARGRAAIEVDGVYGKSTSRACATVLWLLGAPQGALEHGCTVNLQRIIRRPALRPPTWLARASARKKADAAHEIRIERVIAWAKSQLGVVEHPANSNRGPAVSKYQREFGLDGQPWCGAFVGYALRKIGGVYVPPGIVYTPNILYWAQNNLNGFSFHKTPQPGDLALFKFPGVSNDTVDHVGLVIKHDGTTIEGNTSSGSVGSQNNGGGVFQRHRDSGLVGYARPTYK
jgi:hypothetical protein